MQLSTQKMIIWIIMHTKKGFVDQTPEWLRIIYDNRNHSMETDHLDITDKPDNEDDHDETLNEATICYTPHAWYEGKSLRTNTICSIYKP